MTNEITLPTRNDLREIPRDAIVDAKVTNVETKTWRDFIAPEKLDRFTNPDELIVFVTYEFEGFKRDEKFNYMDKPTTTSRLGRYIVKYDTPTVGQDIKVQFDDEGKSNIVLAK